MAESENPHTRKNVQVIKSSLAVPQDEYGESPSGTNCGNYAANSDVCESPMRVNMQNQFDSPEKKKSQSPKSKLRNIQLKQANFGSIKKARGSLATHARNIEIGVSALSYGKPTEGGGTVNSKDKKKADGSRWEGSSIESRDNELEKFIHGGV